MKIIGRVVAVWQIIGGVAGMVVILSDLLRLPRPQAFAGLLPYLFFLALSGASAFAGLRLWNAHASGILTSLLVQILQLPKIALGGFAYHFWLLAAAPVGANLSGLQNSFIYAFFTGISWRVGPSLPEESVISANLLALLAILFLFILSTRPKRKDEGDQNLRSWASY